MKKLSGAALVVTTLLLFACGRNNVEGTYYNVSNGGDSIELKRDGQFHLKAGTEELTGKYLVEGQTIVLNPGSKMAARGTIEKGLIIDNDGTRWQKK